MTRIHSHLLLALLACWAAPSNADSWLPAEPKIYVSPDQTYRVRIDPRPITSPLAYFSDKVKGREPAGAPKGHKDSKATATIEHLENAGQWIRIWSGNLSNQVAPVDALIADGGKYLVTFDNWHSMGYGQNVVAIYDGHGQLIRALALSDIVSADHIAALQHSVSSIQWRGEPHLTPEGLLVIPIVVPDAQDESKEETYLDAVLRLSDGPVISGSSPDWQRAEATAQFVARQKRDYEEQAKQAFIAPLLGPSENTERNWHGYLNEAFYRSSPDWKDETTSTTVLRDPNAPDYAASEGWLRDALLSLDYEHGTMSFASIAPFDFFVARVKAILADAEPGQLKGSKVHVAAPTSALPLLQTIFAKTGARVFVFDPNIPIPQRPDRLKRYLSRD